MTTPLTVKVQSWSSDLRLPCVIQPDPSLLTAVDAEFRRKQTVPFQSKHLPALKRNVWHVLKRPADRSRSGLLWVWPEQKCCVYISGEPLSLSRRGQTTPRVALIRLRIDPQFFADGVGPTVFSATLAAASRKLSVEDTLMWKGRSTETEPFSKRLLAARQWLEHYCMVDPRLLGGVDVELARWKSLDRLTPEGVWELQSDDSTVQQRLLWIANHTEDLPFDSVEALESPISSPIAAPVLEGYVAGPLVAIATRGTGPEQWMLASANGVSLGRALIQTLEVSAVLRASSHSSKSQRVTVVWNADFQKWAVTSLSDEMASHSSAFIQK